MQRVWLWLALIVVIYAASTWIKRRFAKPLAVDIGLACFLLVVGYQIWQWPGVAITFAYCLWQSPTVLREEREHAEFKAQTAELRRRAGMSTDESEKKGPSSGEGGE